jgi:hypothetical protein
MYLHNTHHHAQYILSYGIIRLVRLCSAQWGPSVLAEILLLAVHFSGLYDVF